MLSVAQFGTFEVDNYGDRLFPLILEKELTSRIPALKLQLYSPLPESHSKTIKPILSPGKSSCFSPDLPRAIVIGGGDIISFSNGIASFYKQNWHHSISPHTACWAIPSIQRPPGVPIIWNAPGVPYEFTKDQAFIIRSLAAEADYLSVRDEVSLSHLLQAGVDQPVTIVPDTAILLPKHFSADYLKPLATKRLDFFGLAIGEPLIVQFHPSISEKSIPIITRILQHLKAKLKRPILLLPIGYCHHDCVFLEKLKTASNGAFQLVEDKLDGLSLAALIAHAGCFIGTSLHGNVTAFAYQVPHMIYNGVYLAKLKGFAQLIQEPERCISDFKDLLNREDLLNQRPSARTVAKLSEQITSHFDRMAKITLQTDSTPSKPSNFLISEHYIQVVHEAQNLKEQLDQIHLSKAWHLACLIKKIFTRIPLAKAFLNRLFSLIPSIRLNREKKF